MEIIEASRFDYETLLSRDPFLILIVGSVEQHGEHLPFGTDTLIPMGIAKRISSQTNALICPPIPFGVYSGNMSGGGRRFPGTTCISSGVLENLVCEIIEEYALQGFKRFLILNGHSENDSSLVSAVNLVLKNNSQIKAIIIAWWNMLSTKFIEEHIPRDARDIMGAHASYLETLALLAVRPDLVKLENLRPSAAIREAKYEIIPIVPETIPSTGVAWPDNPKLKTTLTEDLAQLVLDEIVKNIIKSIHQDLSTDKKR